MTCGRPWRRAPRDIAPPLDVLPVQREPMGVDHRCHPRSLWRKIQEGTPKPKIYQKLSMKTWFIFKFVLMCTQVVLFAYETKQIQRNTLIQMSTNSNT